MQLDAIIELARRAHAGQHDKLGRDYFTGHLAPIAAGASLFGPQAVQAAWLHDIIEDTDVTGARLLELGVDPAVVAAVESVTRRSDESYEELIRRSSLHPIGRLVKLVDNAWNIMSNPQLARSDPERARLMLEQRYYPARDRLLAAIGINQCWLGYTELQQVLESERDALVSL